MTALTEEMLEQIGFTEKYKSVHSHWYYWGFAIEQVSDEDGYGGSIEQEEKWHFKFTEECNTLEDLKRIMERETEFILDIENLKVLNNPKAEKRKQEELLFAETTASNFDALIKLGISGKNAHEAKYQKSLEEAIDYLKKRGKYW